tara:strand:+ start:707 stop:1759 length:1053 start_codon:yes stop_codon:yes gene_type:complete
MKVACVWYRHGILGLLLSFLTVSCWKQRLRGREDHGHAREQRERRGLRHSNVNEPYHKAKPSLYIEPDMLGTRNLTTTNATVYGAIIMSTLSESSNLQLTKTWRDDALGNKSMSTTEMAAARLAHARQMILELPFPVVEWPPIFAGPCPQIKDGHGTERGLAFAHYQIWLDFIHFDHDVLLAAERKDFKGTYSSSDFSSIGSRYMTSDKGTLYKNGIPFLEDDIIVVFEDDADIAIKDLRNTLQEEFAMMHTDILYLGWCSGRLARPVPLCMHAYALTRRGARKLVKYFEPCGPAVDLQLVIMGKNKWITYRTANPWSYQKSSLNERYPHPHDFTNGIFHQVRIGSFNGH